MHSALTDASTAPGRAPRWWWPFIAGASVLSLLLHGYHLHGDDNEVWLPVVQHVIHPELFPGDPLIATAPPSLPFHVDALALAARGIGIEWASLLMYLCAHAAFFALFATLARDLLEDHSAAALSVLLLVLPHPIGGTATLTVESLLIPRVVGCVLGLGATVLALRRRPIASGAMLGLTLLWHPLSGWPFFAAVLGRPLVLRREWGATLRTAVAGAAFGSPAVVRYLSARMDAGRDAFPDAQWWEVARRAAYFVFVRSWTEEWLFVLAFVVLLLFGIASCPRGREALALLVGAVMVMIAADVIGEGLHVPSVMAFQPARALVVPCLLAIALSGGSVRTLLAGGPLPALVAGVTATAFLAGWWGLFFPACAVAAVMLARRLTGLRRTTALAAAAVAAFAVVGPWRDIVMTVVLARPERLATVLAVGVLAALAAQPLSRRAALAPAGGLLVGACLLAWAGPARFEWPWSPRTGPAAELTRWARESTPLSTRFVVPASLRDFRSTAERPLLFDPTDGGPALYSRLSARDWVERYRRFGPGSNLPALVEEVRRGNIDVLVLPRDAPEVPLPVVHVDATYRAHARASP